ncbi:MAG: NAD(P)-binding domain-containing protein, partial [Thermomicrobiales bacterium]|nr:NAD(P)-binding domain-containing protein [Thermomicrobiales bacterium]
MTVVEPNALQGARIAFIGAGVMAESMLGGLLSRGLVSADQVVASHPRADRRAKLEERFGVTTTESNLEAAQRADLVLLTIKPQVLKAVAKQLHGQLSPGQVVISVIAGANVNTLRKQLGHSTLVRVMPNTPSQIGEGMIVWYCADEVTDAQAAQVKTALSALGVEMRVDEEKYIDMATALSATGPTYIFMMMEALI